MATAASLVILVVAGVAVPPASAPPAAALAAQTAAAVAANDQCASCHAGLNNLKLEQPVTLMARDVHGQAGITCVACHGGDAATSDKDKAHGAAGFVGRPAGTSVLGAMCGKCHKQPAENYLKSPHQNAAAAKRPGCATCHGAHGIQKASLSLIGEPLCTQCHTFDRARRIQKALLDAEREVKTLDDQLAAINNVDGRKKLMGARADLRGLAHSLNLLEITRNAARALATVDEVRARTVPPPSKSKLGQVLPWVGGAFGVLFLTIGFIAALRLGWLKKEKWPVLRALNEQQLKWLGIAGGVLTLVGAVGAWRMQHYIDHDPKFCLSCHTMNSAFDLWSKSGHKDVDCHTCHIPNLASNLHQVWLYTTEKPDKVAKHAEIDRAICEQCHASKNPTMENKWKEVVDTPGHRVHAGKQRIECVQCHAMSVHAFKPPRDMCVTCHKKETLKSAGTMAEMHCMQCHPFIAPEAKRTLKPDRTACLDCHERRQIKGETFPTKKAAMNWECGKCHKPHDAIRIGNPECVACHKEINEGVHKVKAHANDCQGCHKPHGWTSGSTPCASCHEKITPANHHAEAKKSCTDCHGAWDDGPLSKK